MVFAIVAEGVDIGIANPAPVTELDPEFEGGIGEGHQLAFVQAKALIEKAHMGQGGLADADGSDLFRFHQGDLKSEWLEQARQTRRCHPAGCASACDDDSL